MRQDFIKEKQTILMEWTPKQCRGKIEELKRMPHLKNKGEQIAIIREHLKSIGKD